LPVTTSAIRRVRNSWIRAISVSTVRIASETLQAFPVHPARLSTTVGRSVGGARRRADERAGHYRTDLPGAVRDSPLWATQKTGLIKAMIEIG